MNHTISFYVAPRIENSVLQCIDDKNKIICKVQTVHSLPIKEVSEDYFRAGMRRAKEAYKQGKTDYWVAAVRYMDNFFKEDKNSIIFRAHESEFEVKE